MNQQFTWGSTSQHPNGRRGLTPISTAFNSANRSNTSSNSPSRSSFSPANPGFPGLPPPRNTASRNSSASSNSSPNHSGSHQQQPSQLLSSARSRTIASSSNPQLATSAAALSSASQGGGGPVGSGGGATSRLARASPSLSQPSTAASPNPTNPTSVPPGQSLAKIVIAQIFLLLSTMKEDKAQAQTEQIRKLVDAHGMEVFSKYFRRQLQSHASQVFGGSSRGSEPTNRGQYDMLVEDMQKITLDPQQAHKIAESIDTPEGDLFRDFDLSTFMEHFRLDPVAKTTLALAFKTATKSDLRTKADAILTSNYANFIITISQPKDNLTPTFLASVVERLIQYPPRNWTEDSKFELKSALETRFLGIGIAVPSEVASALYMMELIGPENHIVRTVQRAGPQGTATLESCKDMLASVEVRNINYTQVTSALLFMAISQWPQSYNASNFVSALREHRAGQRLDWQDVVHSLDREQLRVTKQQFLSLYRALSPLAQDYENFDIQLMWGGDWKYPDTQLSFVVAFLSCSPDEVDANEIPRLRKAFTLGIFEDSSESVKLFAESAIHHPMVSLDATAALFTMIFRSGDAYNHAQSLGIPETVINANTDIFVVSAAAVPKPWGPLQDQALRQLFRPFLHRSLPHYDFVLHGLWKQDHIWLAARLYEAYGLNHMALNDILEHANEHGWIQPLIHMCNELSLDLAALVHARDLYNIDAWIQETFQKMPQAFPKALNNFLYSKAEHELQTQRDKTPLVTVPLAIKTVQLLLSKLENQLSDEDLVGLQRTCIQSYPRLINYGEGESFDRIIDENGKDGNSMSPEADQKMQEHYRKMYAKELDVRDIVDALRNYKISEDPADQDLFCCMIHGLFDEYNCFGEYPLDALATTAVLFGGIINYRLLSRIALQAALAMILEAVQKFKQEQPMYKFGLQALLHFSERLQEWPAFCSQLLQIPALLGTEVFLRAQDIVGRDVAEINGMVPNGDALLNGDDVEDTRVADSGFLPFTCLHVAPPAHDDIYEEPDEDVSDKVLFVLNNVSERNLKEKLKDLKDVLEEKHYQWFANYLVEERAKMQPNFQNLYLDMLQLIDDRNLWAEVLRETYVAVIPILENAESTLNNSTERTHLRNLGEWLGLLTIARDKPILFKNISFKDLLCEAAADDPGRVAIVVPFTCKVLAKAAKSTVFKPPNPWLLEIIRTLMVLYEHSEAMGLPQKFATEVLCRELGLNHKDFIHEPSRTDGIYAQILIDYGRGTAGQVAQKEGTEGGTGAFGGLPLPGSDRNRGPIEHFSPAAITASLPDLRELLSYPPTQGNAVRLNNILLTAAQQAVTEIIAPVVERSVTIAAISTANLVLKDFADEPDEDRLRTAAHNVVKVLSGSLALVTCKEPLRMSIMNNIRVLARDTPEQTLPEGLIMMFVNDNLDIVCRPVVQAAESKSIPEIDFHLEESLRNRHVDPPHSGQRSSQDERSAIYNDFGNQTRPSTAHANTASQDSSREVPDVLKEPFPPISSLATPAEVPAVPRQNLQQPPRLHSIPPPQQTVPQYANGNVDVHAAGDRVQDFLGELQHAARGAPEDRTEDLAITAPTRRIFDQLVGLIETAEVHRETLCFNTATKVANLLYSESNGRLEVEVLVALLARLCQSSVQTAKQVLLWLDNIDDDRVFNAFVTLCLVKERLIDIHRVDLTIAKALHARRENAAEFLGDLLDEMVINDLLFALRSDFATSLEALTEWLAEEPDLEIAQSVLAKLQDSQALEIAQPSDASNKNDQMDYIFMEWIQLQRPDTPEKFLTAFINQLHRDLLSKNKDDAALFIRICVELSVAAYEQEELTPFGNLDNAYINVDGLARLIVALLIHQGGSDGAVRETKAKYLDGLLSVIVLVLCNHHDSKGEHFNSKVFFRLFSALICELQSNSAALAGFEKDLNLVLGRALLATQPAFFPAFSFGWLGLVAHRMLIPAFIKDGDNDSWNMYARIIELMLAHTGELVKTNEVHLHTRSYYRAVLRILLVVHHDFPEFLAENHFGLCNAIPVHCTQLRNLVVSAYPSSFPELPDPFMNGFKVDRMEEIRKAPAVRADLDDHLRKSGVKDTIDNLLHASEPGVDDMEKICHAIYSPIQKETGFAYVPIPVDVALLHAIVLYVVSSTLSKQGPSVPTFNPASPSTRFLETLSKELGPEARYYLVGAMASQLRWPNSHTHYYSYMILHLFKPSDPDANLLDVQHTISRVLLERLLVHRPHPWGLIITLLEIMKAHGQVFWNLPFVKATPEVERLFEALFQHIQQSPRSLG